MGNKLLKNDLTNEFSKTDLLTYQCFEKLNWTCPEKITVQLYEISIVEDIRRLSNKYKIKEIFLPEFNASLNNTCFYGNNYNIILNTHERYNNDAKLLKTIVLNNETKNELFELVKYYVKAKTSQPLIDNLFSQLDVLN